jgi:putative transposase
MASTPAAGPVRKPRARKRVKGAPTHVRSWPLRPDSAQCGAIGIGFFTGLRVYNAVLGECITRSRAMKADPDWESARRLPHGSPAERQVRRLAIRAVEAAHGFTADAAQSFASSLRKAWVREHLPAQEAQNLGARAFDAVKQRHLGKRGRPRFKNARRGMHSLAAKDGNGALRPKTDAADRLVGLQ